MAQISMQITMINKIAIKLLCYFGITLERLRISTFYLRKLINKIPFAKVGKQKIYTNL
jgi:hypothetical protein